MSMIDVNGTSLYYELRGEGPALVLVSGAGGDAQPWAPLADALADEFTVLTYDRRANSRSPRPTGWTATTMDEQADDAAALLQALDLAPAVAYGSSLGAVVVTALLLRHPQVLRGAVLHEPPLGRLSPAAAAPMSAIRGVVQEGLERGGPPVAMEAFLRWMVSDEYVDGLPAAQRARVLGNAEVFLGLEMPALADYLPPPEQLAEVEVPCVVGAGIDDRDPDSRHGWFAAVAQVLASQLGADVVEMPGSHVPQITHPQELAEVVRGLVRALDARPARGVR